MTVFRNAGRWDASNVEFQAGEVRRYDKVHRTSVMQHIDYGLGVLDAEAFNRQVGDNVEEFDLADLYRHLLRDRLLAGQEVHERFFEIGSACGLAETEAFLERQGTTAVADMGGQLTRNLR